eukprot:7534075-Karenia_brevis.AAC.1
MQQYKVIEGVTVDQELDNWRTYLEWAALAVFPQKQRRPKRSWITEHTWTCIRNTTKVRRHVAA